MTLPAETVRVQYAGTGAQTAFPITFVFWDDDDLEVVHQNAAGVDTDWVRGTQYTVTGGDGATGTLTVVTSPTDYTPLSGETLTIKSARPNTQETDLPLGGALPSTDVEQMVDQTVRLVQQVDETLGRALTFPVSDPSGLSAELPTSVARASQALHFDSAGKPVAVVPTDASGTIVTATGSLTARSLAERFADEINVKDEDVVVDGTGNQSTALQALFDKIVAAGIRRKVKVPSGTLRCLDPITVDISFIALEMDKVEWDWSASVASGFAVTFTGTENLPRAQYIQSTSGYNMVGPGKAGTLKGLDISGTPPPGPNRLMYRDIRVNAFLIGAVFGSSAYMLNFSHCDFTGNGHGIDYPAGASTAAESYAFDFCLFAENDVDLRVDSFSDWYFTKCRFDASAQILDADGAAGHVHMEFHACHFEKVQDTWASAPFKMSGAVTLVFFGGQISQGSQDVTLDYLFDHSNSSSRVGGVWLFGTRIQNMFTTNDRLYNGEGRFKWDRMDFLGTTTTIERPHSTQQNLLLDGGFEDSLIVDDWSVWDDGVNVPTAFDTSPRCNLSLDAVEFNSGAQSLQFAITTGACSAGLFVPGFAVDEFPLLEFFYKWDVAPTQCDVSMRWARGYVDPTTRIWQSIKLGSQITYLGNLNATAWTKVTGPPQGQIFANMNPGGYNAAVIFISFSSGVVGKNMFIDDFVVNRGG